MEIVQIVIAGMKRFGLEHRKNRLNIFPNQERRPEKTARQTLQNKELVHGQKIRP